MENSSLPTKALTTSHRDLSNSYVAHLYHTKGYSIKQAIEADECDIIDYDYSKVGDIDKEKIKERVLFSNHVIMYLDIDLVEISSDKIIKPPSCEISTSVPFICVGWSDYEYLKSYAKQGKKIKNRGYLMLYPIDKPYTEENLYYLPYKFVKNEGHVVREVWYFNNVESTVIPPRQRIEMLIGDNIIKDGDRHYEVDASAYYHIKGNPMVPIRIVAEHLGYTVTWKRFSKVIILNKDSVEIVLKVGENKCFVNGTEITTFLPVTIDKYNNRAYVTLGFIRSIFDCDAEFIKSKQLIKIYRNN